MFRTPHKDKLTAALANPKCGEADRKLLNQVLREYSAWIEKMESLTSTGKQRVDDVTKLVNEYKDILEVELIAKNGSDFLKRQKGQLKLDSSVLEEFLVHLIDKRILAGL